MLDNKILFKAQEAADALAIDVSAIYRLAREGVLEKRFIGKGRSQFRIPRASLEAYADSLPTEPVEAAS